MSEPTTPTRELLVRYQAIFQAALSLLQAQNIPNGITEQLASEWQDIRAKLAKLAKLDAEIARRKAEIATVPMAQSREADFKRLVGEGFISSHATQDKTKATQREKLTQPTAPVDGTVPQLPVQQSLFCLDATAIAAATGSGEVSCREFTRATLNWIRRINASGSVSQRKKGQSKWTGPLFQAMRYL